MSDCLSKQMKERNLLLTMMKESKGSVEKWREKTQEADSGVTEWMAVGSEWSGAIRWEGLRLTNARLTNHQFFLCFSVSQTP